MLIETVELTFRIPKVAFPVVCHTFTGEKFAGEIFLDVGDRRVPGRVLEFFNSGPLFLPVRISGEEKPRIVSKNCLTFVETSPFVPDIRKDPSEFLTQRKNALFLVESLGSIPAEILIDTPADQSRVLDVLNLAQRFVPVLYDSKYCLLNTSRILEVKEL
jgi:hypothetical protein